MARRRSLRLSTRVTLFFGAMALLGGIGLAVATFLFARNSLLDQRVVSARAAAVAHASDLNSVITAVTGDDPVVIRDAVRDIETDPDGYAVLLTSTTSFPERNLRFNVNGAAELVHFDRRSSVTGMRWDLSPHVTFPYRTAAGYVVPKATLRYTGYALDDNPPGTDDDPSRLIPTFSLDSGLFFERPFRFRGGGSCGR